MGIFGKIAGGVFQGGAALAGGTVRTPFVGAAVGAAIGGIGGFATSDMNSTTVRMGDAGRGAAIGALAGLGIGAGFGGGRMAKNAIGAKYHGKITTLTGGEGLWGAAKTVGRDLETRSFTLNRMARFGGEGAIGAGGARGARAFENLRGTKTFNEYADTIGEGQLSSYLRNNKEFRGEFTKQLRSEVSVGGKFNRYWDKQYNLAREEAGRQGVTGALTPGEAFQYRTPFTPAINAAKAVGGAGLFVAKHPGLVAAGAGAAVVAGYAVAGNAASGGRTSPTMRGANMKVNYNQSAIAAENMRSGVAPMGKQGISPDVMGPPPSMLNAATNVGGAALDYKANRLQASAQGLGFGLHAGRHG